MNDIRFHWFKHIVYKTLSIDSNDSAFNDMIEKDQFAVEHLNNIISNIRNCIFFHCSVEEEEVEVEDVFEQAEESEKNEASTSSESEKLEFESEFADDKTEVLDNEDVTGSMTPKRYPSEAVSDTENGMSGKRLSRRSTTSLLQIIKKNVLHLSLNITTFVPSRRYVYFLKCRQDEIPVFDTVEEVFSNMPDFFEVGSINQHPLIAMKKVISHIYLPILKNENWLSVIPPEECKMDENQLLSSLKELCRNIEEFSTAMEETISHIEKPIMFTVPNVIATCSTEELAQEQSFVTEAEDLVNEWTERICNLLEETALKKLPESDLLGEFNYWKRQKLVLSTCYDHLSKPSIQRTLEILKIADSDLSQFEEKVAEVEKQLKVASDNFNYLSLLEPLRKNMLPEKSFEDTQKAVEDIFSILKIIWLQSNYYKNVPNMCRLIKGIAMLLKDKVKNNANVETLFRKPLSEIKSIVTQSLQLLQFWKDRYLKECQVMEKYGGFYSWGFEINVFFTETDHMILVCSDLEKVIVMLEQLCNIFNTNLKYFVRDVKGLDVLEVRVFGITSRIQYANFDIYDPAFKSEWDSIMETFQRDINNFEDEIKIYMQKMFRSTLSWEDAYILTKSFQKVSVSSRIQDFIDRSHDDMLKQFIKEIYEKENEFLSCKDEPPHYLDIPEIISSVIWVQDLLLKLSRPMSQICDHSDLTKREHEVMERFQKTETLLKEYKFEKHNSWKITVIERLNKFLQENVLKICEQAASSETNDPKRVLTYQVNFPIYLEDISIETKLFEYFGFEIPVFVQNVILQERSYYEHRHEIRMILDLLKKSLSCLNEDEISILGIPVENVCSVLELGLNSIQWESSEISEFVKNMKRAVSIFRNLINQVQNVFAEIDKRIESMSHCDLFEFNSYDVSEVPTCEIFFEDAETRLETKIEKIVNIYTSLGLLLKNLERLTCKTASGKATQMKQYYRRCEEKILASLLKMTLSNLEYFKEELLENYIFPYIELAYQSEDELVASSLNRAELIFLVFIRNAVESTRRIIRWLDGTCLPSSKFYLEETNEEMEFSYYLDICMHPYVKDWVLNILNDFFTFMNKINSANK